MLYTIQLFPAEGFQEDKHLHRGQTMLMVVEYLRDLMERKYWEEDPWAVIEVWDEDCPRYTLMRVTMDDLMLMDWVSVEREVRDSLGGDE